MEQNAGLLPRRRKENPRSRVQRLSAQALCLIAESPATRAAELVNDFYSKENAVRADMDTAKHNIR
jgi:hypothetical protein